MPELIHFFVLQQLLESWPPVPVRELQLLHLPAVILPVAQQLAQTQCLSTAMEIL